ncbi:MAG: hypothetical protein HDR45_00520 [Bacteroides sp.]|nr:hypothetical protein [Bacteroides sp.]
MSEYSKKPTDGIRNKQYSFYTIYVDGKSPFEDFCASLKQTRDISNLKKLYAIMDRFGDNLVGSTMVNHIHGAKYDRDDVYEFKKDNMRIYFALMKPNVMLLLGGFKGKQEKSIETVFRKFNQLPTDIPDYEP